MRLIQHQNMTVRGLFGKTENSLMTLLAALISGIIFGAESIEQEQNSNFMLWATQGFCFWLMCRKSALKYYLSAVTATFTTEGIRTVTLACNFISTSIYSNYSTQKSHAPNQSCILTIIHTPQIIKPTF